MNGNRVAVFNRCFVAGNRERTQSSWTSEWAGGTDWGDICQACWNWETFCQVLCPMVWSLSGNVNSSEFRVECMFVVCVQIVNSMLSILLDFYFAPSLPPSPPVRPHVGTCIVVFWMKLLSTLYYAFLLFFYSCFHIWISLHKKWTFHLLPSVLQMTLVRVRFCCLGMFCSVNCGLPECSSMLLQSNDNHFPVDKA